MRPITSADLRKADRFHLHPNTAPHVIQDKGATFFLRGEGIYLEDADGNRYIDAYSGMGNVILGHGNTTVIDAIKTQLDDLCYVPAFFAYGNAPAAELANAIATVAPPDFNHVHFCNMGSEANEVAFKLARLHHHMRGKPEKWKFVSQEGAYHGATYATMAAGGIPHYRTYFGPGMDGFVFAKTPNTYRSESGNVGAECAADLERIIKEEGPETIAGFIIEPVMGVGGHLIPPPDYYPAVREICDRYDILLLADEVVCGFGRTGTMFGLEHWHVTPDIMTLAKGITSGYLPLAATVISDEVWSSVLQAGPDYVFPHGTTTSAHPVCCAAGLAVLNVLQQDGLIKRSRELGTRLLTGLQQGLASNPIAGDVRGLGLLASVELVNDRKSKERFPVEANVGKQATKRMMDDGVIVRCATDIISLRPPLISTEAEIDRIVAVVVEAIDAAAAGADIHT